MNPHRSPLPYVIIVAIWVLSWGIWGLPGVVIATIFIALGLVI